MSNYSKSFGLTFINNDHFFATVAIFQNIFNGGCRILWGLSYDRFGLRKCMITLGLITTVLTASLPLLPYLGQETGAAKAGYGLVMVVLYGTFPGIYPVVAPAVAEAFGPVHYKANFGLLLTQSLAYSATILIITQVYNIILQGHRYVQSPPQLPTLGTRHLHWPGIHRHLPPRWSLRSYRSPQQPLPAQRAEPGQAVDNSVLRNIDNLLWTFLLYLSV